MPATEHEVLEWMTDRQEEMIAALMAWNPTEAARISSLITHATRRSSTRVGTSVHGHQHGSVRIAQEARTISRYGLRGSRVGEASNPGPPHLRRLRRASQSRIGQSPVSSDEELLVRANTGRDVLPRDAIQQTLIDTDSEDGRPLLQLEPLPEDVISARDPISAVGGPRHQGSIQNSAFIPQSSQGTPRSIQDRESLWTPVSVETVLQHWMRIHDLKCT